MKIKIIYIESKKGESAQATWILSEANLKYEINSVSSINECKAAIDQYVPDVILSGHDLSAVNSLEVLNMLNSLPIKIPLIIITEAIKEEFCLTALKNGADDYVLKDRLQRLPFAINNAVKSQRTIIEFNQADAEYSICRKKLVKLLDKSVDVICTANSNGLFVDVSAASEKMWGYKPEEMIGQPFIDFVFVEDVDKTIAAASDIIAGTSASNFENRYKHKSGKLVSVNWSSRWDEETGLMYAIARDVTEKKNAEIELRKITDDLIQRSKSIEQFSYIISHNLRAPIANILGLREVLKNSVSEAERARIIGFLFIAVQKLDEIVKDLNKIMEVKFQINESRQEVSMPELLNVIQSGIENRMPGVGIRVFSDFNEVDRVSTLKSYLHSIFCNLISNSVKFKSENKEAVIWVKSFKTKNGFKISFTDNGIGIDLNENGDKLFGLYKRFHPHIEGKGLGLFMVKTQVEALQGTISVKTKPNEGTEFIIELPF